MNFQNGTEASQGSKESNPLLLCCLGFLLFQSFIREVVSGHVLTGVDAVWPQRLSGSFAHCCEHGCPLPHRVG